MRNARWIRAAQTLRRGAAIASAIVLTGGLLACGGGSGGGSSPTMATSTAPQRSRIDNGTFTGLQPVDQSGQFYFAVFQYTASGTATVDASVNWTFAANDIDIGLFRGDCLTGSCGDVVILSETLSKPETLRTSITSGTYTLAIVNLGPGSEGGTYEIFLTR